MLLRKPSVRAVVVTQLALMLFAAGICHAQPAPPGPSASTDWARPLMLEKNEGELRLRRKRDVATPASISKFMLKVSPKNNGSAHLVLGTEDVPPGGLIPLHKHLEQDEILLIQTGTAHVWLGNQERDLHAGGLVFIPSNTWVSLKNTGSEPISLVFLFSAPGFDDFLRCTSVAASETVTAISKEERENCQHEGHVVYAGPGATPKQ